MSIYFLPVLPLGNTKENMGRTLLTFSVRLKKIILKILKTSSFLFYIRNSQTSLERHDGE